MSQSHLFVMDPFAKLNLKLDSSLRMALSLTKAGSKCYFTTQNQLGWNSKSKFAHSRCAEIIFDSSDASSARLGNFESRGLSFFNGIHMRKDPPFDLNYVASTWLLDAVPENTKVFNNPEALRAINEKLSIFLFEDYADKALLSANPEEILDFLITDCNGEAIIKPLDLFGGKGISRLKATNESEKAQVLSQINNETDNGMTQKLVQPFNHKIFDGEIRAFTAGGESISYCLKKPKEGDYLANTGSGATLHSYKPSEKIEKMILDVSKKLMEHGVFLAGYDIIGDYISEINITSPRLLLSDNESSEPYYDKVASLMINYCET